jgi:hypothetical protein
LCTLPEKLYKPVTEVVSAKLQQVIALEKGYTTCNFYAYSYSERTGNNFHVGHMP